MRPTWPSLLLAGLLIAPPLAAQECPPADGPRETYRNPRFGFAFDHPRLFMLDPDSVPPSGEAARFVAAGGRATVTVRAAANAARLSLPDLLAEAEGDILQNSRGEITYRRLRDDWFVLSGYIVGRIFYQRTLRLRDGALATLWMEFPRDMRPCLDGAVTMMSLSLREVPRATPRRSP
jgi:hypothetical protein